MPATPGKRSKVLLIALVAFATLIPVAANAAAGFTDVDDNSVYVADIQWLSDSGVTAGCNPPTNDNFCPKANVTREQMAAFMHRLAANRVVDAGMLNGLDDSDFMQHGTIVTTTAGTAWLEHALPPTTVGRNVIDTTVTGDGRMVMPLTAPTTVDGVEYGLASFEMCIQKGLGAAFVTNVGANAADASGGSDQILNATKDLTETGCVTYNVGAAAGHGIGILVETDGSAVDYIRLGSIKATWTTAAASG